MTLERRVAAGSIVAAAMALARPLLAFADAPGPGGVPYDGPPPETLDVSAFAPYVGLAIAILVAALAIRSPRSRRPIAALIVVLVSGVVALGSVVVGAFSCFDCSSHPDDWKFNVAALIVLGVGVVVAVKILSPGRRGNDDSAAESDSSH